MESQSVLGFVNALANPKKDGHIYLVLRMTQWSHTREGNVQISICCIGILLSFPHI
jgi:hypothetical protein